MNLIPPISATPVGPLPGNGLEPGDNPLAGVEGPIFYDEFLAALAKGAGGEGGAELSGSTGETVVPEGETPQGDLQGLPAEVTSQLVDQANFSPTSVSSVVPDAEPISHDASVATIARASTAPPAALTEAGVLVDASAAIKATAQQTAERITVPQEPVSASDFPTASQVVTSGVASKVAKTTPIVPQVAIPKESLTVVSEDTASEALQEVSRSQASVTESNVRKATTVVAASDDLSTSSDLSSKLTPEVSSADRQASVQTLSPAEVSVSPEALLATKTSSPIATSMPGSAAASVVNQRTAQNISQTESAGEISTAPMVEELEVSLVSAGRPVSSETSEAVVSITAATVSSDTTRVIARSAGEIPTQANALTTVDLDFIDPTSSSVQRVTSVDLEMRSGATENAELKEALIENNATQWRFDMRSSTPISASVDSSGQNASGSQANGSTIGNPVVSDLSGSATAAEKFVSTLLGIASSSQPASAADRTISELRRSTTIVSAPHMARWDAAAVQVELVRMIKDGGGQVMMKLTPPDEGSFRIDLSLDPERGVRIFVEGASDSVRTRLEQGAEQLREQFSQMGFNLQLDMHSRREASGQDAGFGFAESGDLGDIGGGRAAAEAGAEVEVSPAARRRSIIDESRVYFRA